MLLVLLSFGWVVSSPKEWEPWTVFITSFAAFVAIEVGDSRGRGTVAQADGPDQRLFRVFLRELPSDGSIAFIRGLDPETPFRMDRLEQIERFGLNWTTADYEFQDKAIEGQRKSLLECIDRYLNCLHANTWSTHRDEFHSVPQEWAYQQKERFDKVVRELNDLADRLVEAHQTLVRMGRDRLGVTSLG